MKLNLPNQITISRLILAVVFFALLADFDIRAPRTWQMYTALGLFIVASLTDWLDGWLARRHNQVTTLGRILDPFVDKVLVCGTYIIFAGRGFVTVEGEVVSSVMPWMAVVIVGRELLVTGLRGVAEARGREFGADVFGKIKTIVQMVTAGVVMLSVAMGSADQPGGPAQGLGFVLVWITIAITAYSGINYLVKARDILAEGA